MYFAEKGALWVTPMQDKLGRGKVGKAGVHWGTVTTQSMFATHSVQFNPVTIAPTTKTPYAHTTVGLADSSIMGNTVNRRIYEDSNHTEIVGSVLYGGQIFNYGG